MPCAICKRTATNHKHERILAYARPDNFGQEGLDVDIWLCRDCQRCVEIARGIPTLPAEPGADPPGNQEVPADRLSVGYLASLLVYGHLWIIEQLLRFWWLYVNRWLC